MVDEWMVDAACRDADPTIFFAFTSEAHAAALEYCVVCPVTVQCAIRRVETEELYANGAPGVWGGQRWGLSTKHMRRAKKAGVSIYRTTEQCAS